MFGKRLLGGQNVSCDFGGGGGGETYHRVRPPKPVLEASPQKVGFAWSVPVSSKENNSLRAKTNGGGETYHRWGGGSKTVLGEGLYGIPVLPFLAFLETGKENYQKFQGFSVPIEPLKSLEKKGKNARKTPPFAFRF